MPILLRPYVVCDSKKPCTGTCTGYDSCSNCPPLIVLAVNAVQKVAAIAPASVASR